MEKRETSHQSSTIKNRGIEKQSFSNTDSALEIGWIWIKKGDTLIEKRVYTGINDDTYVQVLDGLKNSDQVVLGIAVQGIKNPATAPQKSPFMPTRRRTTTPATGTRPSAANR